MSTQVRALFSSPVIRRVLWYSRRAQKSMDRRFFLSLVTGILVFVAIAAVAVTLLEKPWTFDAFGNSFYWGVTTIFALYSSCLSSSTRSRAVAFQPQMTMCSA